jgi:hypothetical protein
MTIAAVGLHHTRVLPRSRSAQKCALKPISASPLFLRVFVVFLSRLAAP